MANEKKIDVVILGLLSHQPMTGYEIKKRIDHELKYFWSGSFGSIYPALNSMEKSGSVEKMECEDGGRGKITYSITEFGRKQLRDWLVLPSARDELKYETILKLFFGGEAGKEMALQNLTAFEAKITQELAMLRFFEKNLESCLSEDEDHLYFLLTVRFGIDTYESHLRWCANTRKTLTDI